jgi:hypothetical protein
MKRTRLLPCPFCGKKPSLTNERMSNHRFLVGCYNASCVVTTSTKWFGSAGGAIEAWNQRELCRDDEHKMVRQCRGRYRGMESTSRATDSKRDQQHPSRADFRRSLRHQR